MYGNIENEINPNGAIYEYDYDAMNRVIKKLLEKVKITPSSGRIPVCDIE